MAGTPEAVTAFMGKVSKMAAAGAEKDLASLRAAKVAHLDGRGEIRGGGHGRAACRIEAWDTAFYSQRILKLEHGVDTEAVRQYFPLDHVVATTLAVYQELLGLSFTELPSGSFPRWHAEVRLFAVYEAAEAEAEGGAPGARVGHFYLDLHPLTLTLTLTLPLTRCARRPLLPRPTPTRGQVWSCGHLPPPQAARRADARRLHAVQPTRTQP